MQSKLPTDPMFNPMFKWYMEGVRTGNNRLTSMKAHNHGGDPLFKTLNDLLGYTSSVTSLIERSESPTLGIPDTSGEVTLAKLLKPAPPVSEPANEQWPTTSEREPACPCGATGCAGNHFNLPADPARQAAARLLKTEPATAELQLIRLVEEIDHLPSLPVPVPVKVSKVSWPVRFWRWLKHTFMTPARCAPRHLPTIVISES